jgi:hypothetical protein
MGNKIVMMPKARPGDWQSAAPHHGMACAVHDSMTSSQIAIHVHVEDAHPWIDNPAQRQLYAAVSCLPSHVWQQMQLQQYKPRLL